MLTREPTLKEAIDFLELNAYEGSNAITTLRMGDIEEILKPIRKLVNEHFNPQPYKFEELKKGMWVWDDKNEMFILITFIDKQFKKMHVCLTEYDGFNDEYVNVEYTEYFEEGRFFPITKAMEHQK